MYDENIMKECATTAKFTSRHNIGGPFGAAVVKDGKVVSNRSNSVLETCDPTAHAEVNAIRAASLKLGTYDLSDCELYATGYPCPMCLGAIMWAGIKKIYISGRLEDAESIGFKDKFIYTTIDNLEKVCYNNDIDRIQYDNPEDNMHLDMEFHDRDIAKGLYVEYSSSNKTIY